MSPGKRRGLPALLLLLLGSPACATGGSKWAGCVLPGLPESVLVARSGPDTLRFVEHSRFEMRPSGFSGIRAWWLLFTFESTDPEALVTDRSSFECRGTQGRSPSVQRGTARVSGPLVTLEVPYESEIATVQDLDVDLTVFRVELWKDTERSGLMDASLDEIPCAPFLLRFAGEGESCWLAVSMADDAKPPPGAADPAEVVNCGWVATTMTLTDAKGRMLVRSNSEEREDTALATFSTHATGTPPPEGDPTIQYPVTVRLRIPEKWRTEVKTFRFRGLPAPPSE